MEDFNKNQELQVKGAKGGGGSSRKVVQNVTVVAPTRQPVIAEDNLFSVAFAKTVYAVSEGIIEGFPNSPEKDIYLDGVPIQNPDGTNNFEGYTSDYRFGEDETQTPIEGFSTTENTEGVSTEITQAVGPIIRAITDTDTERCRVIISHPALQEQNEQNGDISGTSVRYNIEVNSNGGPYTSVFDDGYVEVSGKSDSEFQRAYEFALPGSGPWNVRVSRVTADNDSVYIQNSIFWQSFVEIIDEKFAYPNTALLALKIDARQFNSIPDVSVKLRGKRVQVPTNYNPETRTYTGVWDGTFQMAWTDNPAWIFRDIVLNERFGVRRYVNSIAIDPWYLYTVSQYCDELVPDGAGGYEPRFTCNVYLQNPGGVYEVLNALASCFRGLIYYSEGQLYLTQDRAQLPVQQFSEANVIQDVGENGEVSSPCFNYSGTARTARKTVVLANWDDPNQVYSSVTEYQQDDQLLERFGYNPIDLRLLGVTSRGQALRAAKHTLFSNRYETERVSFRIGAEGLAAGVGEVIQIADPLKQGQRLGGRIRAINGNTITLDAKLNLSESIDYTLTLVVPDGETETNPDGSITTRPKLQVLNLVSFTDVGEEIGERNIVTQSGDFFVTQQGTDFIVGIVRTSEETETKIELDGVIDSQVGALWVLEWSELNAALYKIISVAEIDPLIYQVEAVQYNDSKFAYVDNDLPIAVPKDRFTISSATAPTNLSAALRYSNGQTSIRATWKAPQRNDATDLLIRGYRYQWRKSGDTEWSEMAQTATTKVEIPLSLHVFGNSYQVRVASTNRLGSQSDWLVYDVDAFEAIPDLSDAEYNAVVRHQNQPDGTQLLIVDSGTCPIPERVSGYRCWAKPIDVPTVIPGVKEPDADGWYFLADIPLTGYYTIAFHAPGDWQLRVAFTSSIFGENPADYLYDTVDREEIVPPTPTNFSVVENYNGSGKRFSWQVPLTEYGSWDQNTVADIVGYEVRYKQGSLVNSSPSETWEAGIELASGGLPAQQQWFETALFDSDQWVVMVKTVDATQWRSDDPAYILVNITAPPINNAVQTINAKTQGAGNWPGDYDNCSVVSGDLVQTDATQDSTFTWTFDNNNLESALLLTTTADATYQHQIAALTGEAIEVTQEDDFNILQENDDKLLAEQRFYTESELSEGGVLHPYAPYEKLLADLYRVRTLFKSPDGGSTAGEITALTAQLDYADVVEKINDAAISSAGTAVSLTKTFRSVESVAITALQTGGSTAVTAVIVSKTTSAVTVKCLDSSGSAVAGTVDLIVTGY